MSPIVRPPSAGAPLRPEGRALDSGDPSRNQAAGGLAQRGEGAIIGPELPPPERGGRDPRESPSAVVVAGDEETRILLRGVLRLHHYRVIGEAEGSTDGAGLLRTHSPSVLVIDSTLAEGSVQDLIREARALRSGLRIVLVTPGLVRPGEGGSGDGPDAMVRRPFRLAEFLEALRGPWAAAPRTDGQRADDPVDGRAAG
jgi:CheY-like chemotaxis protein